MVFKWVHGWYLCLYVENKMLQHKYTNTLILREHLRRNCEPSSCYSSYTQTVVKIKLNILLKYVSKP